MFQRKYLGQNGANISFVTQAIKIQQNVATVIASQLFVFSRIVPHHYQPRCHATITGAQITHLFSEELRFVVGTHLSIETSWPPALRAHHWITMVSLQGKEPFSIVVQRLCSPAPPVGQSGGKAERGRFLGGASISLPLAESSPPAWRRLRLSDQLGRLLARDGCSGICLERVAPLRLVSSLESNQSNARGEHRPFEIVSLLRSSLEKSAPQQVCQWRVTPKEEMQDSPSQSRGRCKCTRPACIDWRGWAISAKGRVTLDAVMPGGTYP